MLFISLKSNEIFFFDPVGTKKSILEQLEKKFSIFAEKSQFFIKRGKKLSSVLLTHQLQKENDTWNCGVFICLYFKLMVKKEASLLNKEIDIDSFRDQILSRIKKSKINVCCVCLTKKEKIEEKKIFIFVI